jgi:MFS family permease
VYLRNVLHTSASVGALGFGLFSFGMAGGRFLGDSWIHRFGPRTILQISAALGAIGLWLAVLMATPWAAIAGFALVGLGLANVVPVLFRASSTVATIPASVALSVVTTCGYTGFLVGPPAIGFVTDVTSLSFAFGLIALLLASIAIAGRFVIGGR